MKKLFTITALFIFMFTLTSYTPITSKKNIQIITLEVGGKSEKPSFEVGGKSEKPSLEVGGKSEKPS